MMHDWTLVSLIFDWIGDMVKIELKNSSSKQVYLIAEGLAELKMTKREEWGESASINEVEGPKYLDNGNQYIAIEIQSGDVIEFEASVITLPDF